MGLPEGRVTFLFTDIEGSTRLLHDLGEAYPAVLARHHEIVRHAVETYEGHVMGTEGDAFAVAFHRPEDAVRAAVDAQRGLAAEAWPAEAVRVRMGIHTGPVVRNDTGYVGMALHETARISSCAHGGQVIVSAETERLAHAVPEGVSFTDLGRHRLKDVPEAVRLFQVAHPALPAEFPALRSAHDATSQLPDQRTAFLGRASELAAVRAGLQSGRLVTIVGPGGAGKTRLAVEAAADFTSSVRDGVWFVDLVGAADAAAVQRAWAGAFDLQFEHDAVTTIVDYITSLDGIVVVDNCEHVIDDAADVVDRVLASAPAVRVLATSREPLRVGGEITVPVGPLPPADGLSLFLARAEDAQPGFAPTGEELDAARELCAALDQLPLALELAAARVSAFGVREIANHLDDRFRVLGSGRRGGVERHRTLAAAIEWSYDLLPEDARKVFRRVSILPRGFTVEHATVAVGEQLTKFDVTELLGQLVDKSLLSMQSSETGARFAMLESIESFARDRLLADEETEAWERVLAWGKALAAAFSTGFETRAWRDHLAAIRQAIRPLRSTIAWAGSNDRREDALQLIGDLNRFWALDEDYLESLRVCRAVTDGLVDAGSASLVETKALIAVAQTHAAVALHAESAVEERRRSIAASLAWAGCGDVKIDLTAHSGWTLEQRPPTVEELRWTEERLERDATPFSRAYSLAGASSWWRTMDAAKTRQLNQEIAKITEDLDHDLLRYLSAFTSLGPDPDRGERAAALQRALLYARQLGAPLLIDSTVAYLGRALMFDGELEAADPYFAESEEFCRRTGDRAGLGEVLDNRARLKLWLGDTDTAMRLAEESLELTANLVPVGMSGHLLNVASVFVGCGRFDQAAALLERTDQLVSENDDNHLSREDLRATIARERGDWEDTETRLRAALIAADRHAFRDRALRQIYASFGILAALREPPDYTRAATLLSAAGPPWTRFTPWKYRFDESVERARAALGEEAFAAAWARGEAMTLDEAAEYARGDR